MVSGSLECICRYCFIVLLPAVISSVTIDLPVSEVVIVACAIELVKVLLDIAALPFLVVQVTDVTVPLSVSHGLRSYLMVCASPLNANRSRTCRFLFVVTI